MAPPVSQFTEHKHVPNVLNMTRTGYRQAKPYDDPLAYSLVKSWVNKVTGPVIPSGMDASSAGISVDPNAIPGAVTRNRAYAQWKEKIHSGAQSEILTALAELNQSAEMLASAAFRLAEFARAARKGNIGNAVRALVIHPSDASIHRAHKHAKAKNAAGIWLEFNYGWIPTVQDMWNAMNILCSRQAASKVKAGATSFFTDREYRDVVNEPGFLSIDSGLGRGSFLVRMSCDVKVSNPNLFLMNQLGLLNPVLTLAQVTYMSHVVNWFTGFEAVIAAYTDTLGLSIINPCQTEVTRRRYLYSSYLLTSSGVIRDFSADTAGLSMSRTLGISTPTIVPLWGIKSWKRAANAVAQLVQLLPGR